MERPLDVRNAVLVTGGAGFIGSHLVERLVQRGLRPTVADDLSTGSLDNLAAVRDRVDVAVGGLQDLLSRRALGIERFDYVFHLAGNSYIPTSVEDPSLDFQSNLAGTLALLQALRSSARHPICVVASSAAVYGDPATLPIRESHPTVPISPYGVSKLGAESYAAVYARLYGLPAVSLRLFSAYGPRQKKQVVYDLLAKLDRDPEELEVIGDGTQERDLSFVTDVVEAFLLAATRAPARGEALNVATGASVTIAELVSALCRARGVSPRVRYTGRTRPGDAGRWRVDVSAIRALGYEARTPLESGLRSILAWMRASPPVGERSQATSAGARTAGG